jgi:site-specific DNA-methyltransferase (adenine-specific)
MIQLHCGDCLDILPTLSPQSIDLVLTDPPYGTTKCKWDTIIPLDQMWSALRHVCKRTTPIVLTATQPFTSLLIASNIKQFRYEWIWNKVTARGHLVAKKRPMAQHENVLVFYEQAPIYNPQMVLKAKPEKGKSVEHSRTEICGGKTTKESETVIRTHSYPKTILTFPSESNTNKFHPTQKPVALLEYLIKTYSNVGDTVLDFTMGSGSTGVACVNTGRSFIDVELDEHYFAVAQQRIANAQIQLRLF